MNKQEKSLLIVLPISFLSAGLTVLLFLIDPEFEASVYTIISLVLCTVWMFFLTPSLPFAISWAKNYYESLNFQQAFRLGYLLGSGLIFLAVIFLLAVAPVTGTLWYIKTFKELRQAALIKKLNPEIRQEEDIFNL